MKIKVIIVFGTRPEAVKMAPVIRELRILKDKFDVQVCFTGQHRELSDAVISLFGIVPDIRLDCMTDAQRLGEVTARLIDKLDGVVADIKPDWILAQGDTVTVLAAAIVAHFNQCKFGHVEAGLRSHDFANPFPEEFNRRVADIDCNAYFCPTENARQNLLNDAVSDDKIIVTGNTVIDALHWVLKMPFDWNKSPLSQFSSTDKFVLITAHRRENFTTAYKEIFTALVNSAKQFSDWKFIYPVHLNPNVQAQARAFLLQSPNIHLIEPLDYLSFVNLMKSAKFIVSDSGGVQEEAPSFNVPVLVIRNVTERPEAIASGHNFLVGTANAPIIKAINQQITNPSTSSQCNPYGDGNAATIISNFLLLKK